MKEKNRKADTSFTALLIQRFCAARLTAPASEWVEENVRLNEPKIKGPFSFTGREYLRQMVDSFGPATPEIGEATDFAGCCGTGIGKTIGGIAGMCYRIKNDPMRALVVKPTSMGAAGAKSFSRTRLIPTIKATECLRKLIPTGVDRYDFAATQLQINGTVIDLTGSNSVGQLGENRCDVVWQDEMDKYPEQMEHDREASVVILADERTKSVSNARRYKFSTPTLSTMGIWDYFLKGDQRRYFVPCPHCAKKIVLAWSKQFSVFQFRGDEAYIHWDDSARKEDGSWNLNEVVKSAHLVCPHCQGKILDRHKPQMNKDGKWVATATGAPGFVSWHLPSLYSISQDCNFGQMAKKFLMAKKSLDGVKGFINSDLAEPDISQAVSVNKSGIIGKHLEITGEWIKILSTDYHATAPYFYSVVRAWNGSNASHGIEWRSYNNWYEMDELQEKHKVIKEAVIIDAGYAQAEVARECCNLHMPTRCELAEAVQGAVPEVIGWQPSKSFGGKRYYRVTDADDSVAWQPLRKDKFIDPFVGTDAARTMRVPFLEFLEDAFEDMLENILNKKTGLIWTISPEMDNDEYHRHIANKVKKPWKKNPRDLRWQTRQGMPDHIRLCEVLNLVMAYRLQLISFEAIQVKEKKQ
jgi:DNA-directed RNA polymerase subunit RPC12/RpoP